MNDLNYILSNYDEDLYWFAVVFNILIMINNKEMSLGIN